MPALLDLTRDLAAMRAMGAPPGDIDRLLAESLTAFHGIVPFDLATIMELRGDSLEVRVASGSLASDEVRSHRLELAQFPSCLLYTSPSPRDKRQSRMPSSA